ncbi:MAG: UDP-N-acetylmuramate dehydrogenase [Clostridia bacterium]|nr:UDP-N-acetylmuramate dehydrogenase [Clostridia bacterium]
MYKNYISVLTESDITFIKDEPMCHHTSFNIGGPCDLFVIPDSVDKLKEAYAAAKKEGLKTYLLGKGSNVLFPDEGYNGVVISTKNLKSVSVKGNVLHAESGASFTHIAAVARDAGLSGLEFAYGIPGSVGGAVYMNAGAYGGQVSDCLFGSAAFDPVSGHIIYTDAEDHGFGYRTSIYKKDPEKVILSADFELTPGEKDAISAKMDDFMGRRRDKQPLEYPSAGSVFKRPEGRFVGQMIEELGLKGYTVGGAQISVKHAGFIINVGGATAADVKALIEYIKTKVFEAYDVMLECEVIFVK